LHEKARVRLDFDLSCEYLEIFVVDELVMKVGHSNASLSVSPDNCFWPGVTQSSARRLVAESSSR
jgi:hypothetical protein